MTTYYELFENGHIGRSTGDAVLATELGFDLETNEDIITVSDGEQGDVRMLESEFMQYVQSSGYLEKQLNKAKLAKGAENEVAKNVEFIETSLGRLKTQTPLGDLKVAIPIYERLAEHANGLPEGAVRLYDENGEQVPSPPLTLEQFRAAVLEVAVKYVGIDAKSAAITNAIKNAESLEELDAIEISY